MAAWNDNKSFMNRSVRATASCDPLRLSCKHLRRRRRRQPNWLWRQPSDCVVSSGLACPSYLTFVFDVECPPLVRGNDDGIVQVTDITLNGVSIATDASVFQNGKVMTVVSGTTDTYLPKSLAKGFSDAWEAATGSVSCPYASP